MRRDRILRILGALVAVLGVGIAAALVVLVHLSSVVSANHAQIQRQDDVIHQLAATVAAAQQDASAQRRLVQALQRQVRQLGGQPLTEPPTPPPAAASRPSSPGHGVTPAPRPRPSSTQRPQPSPSPTPSRTPHPRPSVCIPHVTCVPIGGWLVPLFLAVTAWVLG